MPATAPAPSRPRPPVAYEHGQLFQEPVYEDGQPYDGDDDLEGED
jgi:hypothetical protein